MRNPFQAESLGGFVGSVDQFGIVGKGSRKELEMEHKQIL